MTGTHHTADSGAHDQDGIGTATATGRTAAAPGHAAPANGNPAPGRAARAGCHQRPSAAPSRRQPMTGTHHVHGSGTRQPDGNGTAAVTGSAAAATGNAAAGRLAPGGTARAGCRQRPAAATRQRQSATGTASRVRTTVTAVGAAMSPGADGTTAPARSAGRYAGVTRRRQKPCSAPPKRPGGAYDRRPGAAPGRPPRCTRTRATSAEPVRVLLPDEPPRLTPAAARALLRVLVKAHAAQTAKQEGDQQMTDQAGGLPPRKEG